MLSLEKCRKIDSHLKELSDDELINVRDSLYEMAQLAVDDFLRKNDSKNPEWLLSNNDERVK